MLMKNLTFGCLVVFSMHQCLSGISALANAQAFQPGDPCKANPCAHGICISNLLNSTFHCYCEDGYTGINCDREWDECWSNPCRNGGTCIDQIAAFNCTCPPGYSGKVCETNIDECLSNPCLNNGTCVDDVAGYICECHTGFDGTNCEIDISICNITEEKICQNGGRCIDGLGATFTCQCTQGWKGIKCQENIDECLDNPCQNGGMCMDTSGSFICSCPYGYTGEVCDIELEKCDSNPCQNDALCFVVDDSYDCYCVPDYHGPRCQYKYDDCLLPPWPKCFNDGRCLDGVANFSCDCMEGYQGRHCECSSDDLTSCINVEEEISWTLDPNMIYTTLEGTTEQAGTIFENRIDVNISSPSGGDSTISTTMVEPSTTFPPEDLELAITPTPSSPRSNRSESELESSMVPSEEAGTQRTPQVLSPVTSLFIYEVSSNDVITRSQLAEVDLTIATTPVFEEEVSQSTLEVEGGTFVPVTIISQSTVAVSIMTPSSTVTVPAIMTTEESMAREETSTEQTSTEDPDEGSETMSVTVNVDIATETPSPPESDSLVTTTEKSGATDRVTTTMSSDQVSLVSSSSTSSSSSSTSSSTSDSSPMDSTSTSSMPDHLEPVDVDVTTTTSSKKDDVSLLDLEDTLCDRHVCRNGGKCLNTISGPRCHCPLQFRGHQCEEEIYVDKPGFVGHSILVHELSTNRSLLDGFQMMLSFQTTAKEGLVFYAEGRNEEVDMSAFIEAGTLNFKASCGPQHIIFSDPRHMVSTGFLQTINLQLNVEENKCVVILSLNETHTMRGEQEIDSIPLQPSVIYFGQMPKMKDRRDDIVNSGFHGCMHYFELNGVELDLYHDAKRGRDVVECDSAICAIRPCQNGAVCAEHKDTGSWFCNCQPGYAGPLCERPVCATNPCRSGGTCLSSNTGPGFLCLCPVGRHGVLCEGEVKIHQPSFTRSVGGYSSYLAYRYDPPKVSREFSARFHFISSDMNQIALLFFLGQDGIHDLEADYVALSYVKGHILMTWDLGSGPRRIFTKMPVDQRYFVHSVQFGRLGRVGWLKVDQLANVTGRSPGPRTNLNVSSPILYVGGHHSHNFTFLPHDLPVHRGFDGCIFDFSMVSLTGNLVPLKADLSKDVTGRNVFECHKDVCDDNPCLHGGTCVGYGSSYICSCPDGWFGINCQEESSVCTIGKHRCAHGSECSVHQNGTYYCVCPFGKSGMYCEQDVSISDVKFDGHHSVMSLQLQSALNFRSNFAMEIKAEKPDGVLLYLGQSRNSRHQDFLSLALRNSSLVMTLNLGGPRTRYDHFLTLTLCCVTLGEWVQVEMGRQGREGFVKLNGQKANGISPLHLSTLDVDNILFLGGPGMFMDGYSDKYSGCLRRLRVNDQLIPLSLSQGWQGWDITDCDGTACGGDVCMNDGTCLINRDRPGGFDCQCVEPFGGARCEIHKLCEGSDGCENGASCYVQDEIRCSCPMGFMGEKCQKESDIDVPMLTGDGYIRLNSSHLPKFLSSTYLGLEIKTRANSGLIWWIGEDISDEDYMGVGLRNGMIHLVWNLGWLSRTELSVPTKVNDGQWHQLQLQRYGQALEIVLDGELFGSRVVGSYFELNLAASITFGGSVMNTFDMTRGHFQDGYSGCLRSLSVQNQSIPLTADEPSLTGLNVHECSSSS